MIIDFRMRPPVGPFIKSVYGNVDKLAGASQRMGFEAAPSALQKSMNLLGEEMAHAGIGHALVPARFAATGSVSNEDVARIIEDSNGVFCGLAAFDPGDMNKGLEDLDRFVVHGPFAGVGLEPGMLPTPMHADDKKLYPLYDACQEKGIFVSIIAAAACGPDISYTSPALIDRVAHDFPKLVIVDAHAGWPWISQNVYLAHRHPNIYLSPDFIMFNMPGMGDLLLAANYFLQDRFLFATGYPHVGHREAVDFYMKNIRKEVRQKIFHDNAAKLLNFSA